MPADPRKETREQKGGAECLQSWLLVSEQGGTSSDLYLKEGLNRRKASILAVCDEYSV